MPLHACARPKKISVLDSLPSASIVSLSHLSIKFMLLFEHEFVFPSVLCIFGVFSLIESRADKQTNFKVAKSLFEIGLLHKQV